MNGPELTQAREAAGFKRSELARVMRISAVNFTRWEDQGRKPSPAMAERLRQILRAGKPREKTSAKANSKTETASSRLWPKDGVSARLNDDANDVGGRGITDDAGTSRRDFGWLRRVKG